MTAERLTQTEQPVEITREGFGSGRTGEESYQIVLSGEPCTAFIDAKMNECGNKPIGTVDADIGLCLDYFPFCSPEHASLIEERLEADLTARGGYFFPARNGMGRI